MRRIFALLLFVCALLSVLSLFAYAHPGRTDANGGHWNHSTGEYHYHGTPDSNSSGSNSSGNTTNKDWSDSSGDAGEWIMIAIFGGPLCLFLLWVFLIAPIKDKISDRHPKKNEIQPPEEEGPSQTEQKEASKSHPSKIRSSENDVIIPPRSVPAIPRPKITQTPHTTLPPTNAPRGSQPVSQTAPPPPPPFASNILSEHPLLLGADPDYLTEAQVLAYARSIETSRGKKAVTEQFIIKGDLTTNESTKPYQASADIVSLGSAQQYRTTLVRCTCPDHRARHLPCKHMIALAINVNAITIDIEALQKSLQKSL